MFEKEIEFIYNYYLNKIERLNSFVTFEQLASADLHPALLQYVSAEIDYLIYEDRQKLLKESLFDYSGEEINKYFNLIGEEIKLTKKFSKEYITKLLLHATSFNVNYTIRPNWSLLQFIYENESEKYVSEVKQILNYLYYYPYYKRILNNYFNKKHLYKITEFELASLLKKIDKINLENNFDELVDESLKNIVSFINSGEVRNKSISKGIIELFLSDKGVDEPSKILDEKLPGSSEDKFKVDEFKSIILNLRDEEERTSDEQMVTEEDKTEEDELIIEEVSEESEIEEFVEETNIVEEVEESELDVEYNSEDEIDDSADIDIEEAEEFEPPEVDESAGVESSNLQEAYDMVTEEDSNNTEFADDNGGERLNIDEDEAADSYLKELDEDKSESLIDESELEENDETIESSDEEDYIIEGTSVSFSSDELEPIEPDDRENNVESTEEITTEKPTEEVIEEVDQVEFTDSIEEETNDEEQIENQLESEVLAEEVVDQIDELESHKKNIDVAELLKNKRITKVIEHVFDYDMEEFSRTIDRISECSTEEEAHRIIDSIAQGSYLDESSREIKVFKKVISDLFQKK
ncbi:MAG: hypothetical protein ABFS12_01980 [Bacteroidota bacterium]